MSEFTPGEHLESMGIREERIIREENGRPVDRGFSQVDALGRAILRTESYDNEQVSQIEYPAAGGTIENAKIISGPKEGQEYRRELPGTIHFLPLLVRSETAGDYQASFPATLDSLGQTTKHSPDGTHEPWAHFFITDQDALMAFADIEPRTGKSDGTSWAEIDTQLAGNFSAEVFGRTVTLQEIGKINIDFDPAGRPIKATVRKIRWTEADWSADQRTST